MKKKEHEKKKRPKEAKPFSKQKIFGYFLVSYKQMHFECESSTLFAYLIRYNEPKERKKELTLNCEGKRGSTIYILY